MARGTVHQVHGDLSFSWIKPNGLAVAFASTVVFVMVGIESKRANIPHPRLLAADALHHFNQHKAIPCCLFIVQRSNIPSDGHGLLSSVTGIWHRSMNLSSAQLEQLPPSCTAEYAIHAHRLRVAAPYCKSGCKPSEDDSALVDVG